MLQPHPRHDDFARAMVDLAPRSRPWRGVVYRSAMPRFAASADLLTGAGSRRLGGRFNPPGRFAAVYASLSPQTALVEALSHARRYRLPPSTALPRVLVAIRLRLARILDLRNADLCHRLGVRSADLTRPGWQALNANGQEALTQALGRAAHARGIVALISPSAAHRRGATVVWFPSCAGGVAARILRPAELTRD